MADLAPAHPPLRDVHDFLDWVHGQEARYEFVDGRIFAVEGATRRHSDIQVNLIVALRTRLRGGPCRVHGSGLLIRTDPASDRYGRFADVVIECGPPTHDRMIEHPTVIFEVLSPDTEVADRGAKMREYRALPSLQHGVLLSQDAPLVEVYSRRAKGGWLYREIEGPDAVLALTAPDLSLPLRELYGEAA